MDKLKIYLFGKFRIFYDNQPINGLGARKVQELFVYLLVNRDRFHTRDNLADLLWTNSSVSQSKQYLRQSLWQLNSSLDGKCETKNQVLTLESEWIKINPEAELWIDIDKFEKAYSLSLGIQGRNLEEQAVNSLQDAVELYQGQFLKNWYQNWCIFERERFQNMYLIMLDKLMGYCESHRKYEEGIVFGSRILRCDVAQERTYCRLMRLYYLLGDRTSALRQYERCSDILEQELNAKPAKHTVDLYDLIKNDQFIEEAYQIKPNEGEINQGVFSSKIVSQLTQVSQILLAAHQQIKKDIDEIRTIVDEE